MLPPKWIAFLIAFWLTSTIVCIMCEGAWIGEDEESVINNLLNCQLFTSEGLWGKILGVFNPDFWGGLLALVTFDYKIFYGTWEIARLIILLPVTVMVIYSLAWGTLKLIRGAG